MIRVSEIKGIDDHRIRDDGGVCAVCSGIQVILLGKGISVTFGPGRDERRLKRLSGFLMDT